MKKTLSSIGGLFFKVVDEPIEVKQIVTQQVPQPVVQTSSIIGQEDAAIKEQLTAALAAANLPGFDYFEFARALDAQASVIPTEALRFQSVGAMASSMDATIPSILSSAQSYLKVLKQKETEFVDALNTHVSSEIGGKQSQIQDIDKQIQTMAEQIKSITDKMNTLQSQKVAMQNEIATSTADVDKVKNNFYATLKVFVDRINNDVDKIKQYLTGGK
jgi:archaellum component FlaC